MFLTVITARRFTDGFIGRGTHRFAITGDGSGARGTDITAGTTSRLILFTRALLFG